MQPESDTEKQKRRKSHEGFLYKTRAFCKKLNGKEQYAEPIITTNTENTIVEVVTKTSDIQFLGEITVDLIAKEFKKHDWYY